MWNCNKFIICIGFVCLASSTKAAGLFGSLLGENDNNNNRASGVNIPLISSFGLGSNNREVNNKVYNNNDNINNGIANRGLLPLLGGNNANTPNINNVNNINRLPNINQNNPNKNEDLKKQMAEAEKLLERLKELNRLKEQQKLENEKNQGQGKPGNKNPETVSNNKTDIIKDGSVLKTLTKKKFFHVVAPVVPEDEAINFNQTVYFYD